MPDFLISEAAWDELKEDLLIEYNGKTPLHTVLQLIIDNIQAICEVYSKHPEICINLLTQVMQEFTKEEYEDKVILPIANFIKEEPALVYIVESLQNLRKFLGDDPAFINKVFAREISMLPGNAASYNKMTAELCRRCIENTILLLKNRNDPKKDTSCARP